MKTADEIIQKVLTGAPLTDVEASEIAAEVLRLRTDRDDLRARLAGAEADIEKHWIATARAMSERDTALETSAKLSADIDRLRARNTELFSENMHLDAIAGEVPLLRAELTTALARVAELECERDSAVARADGAAQALSDNAKLRECLQAAPEPETVSVDQFSHVTGHYNTEEPADIGYAKWHSGPRTALLAGQGGKQDTAESANAEQVALRRPGQCARCPHPHHPYHVCVHRSGGTAYQCKCVCSEAAAITPVAGKEGGK